MKCGDCVSSGRKLNEMRSGITIVSHSGISSGRRSNDKYILYVFLFILPFTCISCLKEKNSSDCPVVYRVALGVKDKNYDNAGEIPGWSLKNERLPFKVYVSTLMYYLRNEETGTIVQNVPVYSVVNDEGQQELNFSGIPTGRYVLSVFGNNGQAASDRDGRFFYDLHPAGTEGTDTYLLSDTIDLIPGNSPPYVELQRTKGIFYLSLENLPDSVDWIEGRITGIYRNVDQNREYDGETVVIKTFPGDFSSSASLLMNLAPTVAGKTSVVRLALYARGADSPFLFIPDFNVTVKRNEVTAFKLDFKPGGGIEVWTGVGGTWTKLHDMDITMI